MNWCENRLTITAKSVCIDVMLEWVTGSTVPSYRHAVLQGIQFFLAGCAGILRPVTLTSFPACEQLVRHGTGLATDGNKAYEQWLTLLGENVFLTSDHLKTLAQLYQRSGLESKTWDMFPPAARSIMTGLMQRQADEWFCPVNFDPEQGITDGGPYWEYLQTYPQQSRPCDLLMILPSRLGSEISGNSALLSGVAETQELYACIHGTPLPAGQNVNWQRDDINRLVVTFDTQWAPPSGEVTGELSSKFEAEVRHSFSETVNRIHGYNCYDQGDHVDSRRSPPDGEESGRIHVFPPVDEPQPEPPAPTAEAEHRTYDQRRG
ncbi:DUF1281 domain-containing protein [Enterobacteriaceae bacterium H11S18]|uniref:DUF1281 domain-containing protein n=1 Tax=Dryocola clanedunensis TaxID=2925396 RepID=UPI0022F08A2A|nr:DUF1281 domain-containing protein [Dryocola clanedunensis]MCT4711367.1 DUF1281 domain-containing protein [Dryocola clanedunensis]